MHNLFPIAQHNQWWTQTPLFTSHYGTNTPLSGSTTSICNFTTHDHTTFTAQPTSISSTAAHFRNLAHRPYKSCYTSISSQHRRERHERHRLQPPGLQGVHSSDSLSQDHASKAQHGQPAQQQTPNHIIFSLFHNKCSTACCVNLWKPARL